MTHALKTEGLAVGYGEITVLSGLDLVVEPGQIVALLGRNGTGKTTTIMSLAGRIPCLGGKAQMFGAELTGGLHQRVRAGLGLVAEERTVIRALTVEENLRLARVDLGRTLELFPELDKVRQRKAGLLSGGEQQMLALGRAIGTEPKLLLVDELSLGLGPRIVKRLLASLREVADKGIAVFLVEQHATLALGASDYAYVLGRGGIQMHGTSSELHGRVAEIERSYLSAGGAEASQASTAQSRHQGRD